MSFEESPKDKAGKPKHCTKKGNLEKARTAQAKEENENNKNYEYLKK